MRHYLAQVRRLKQSRGDNRVTWKRNYTTFTGKHMAGCNPYHVLNIDKTLTQGENNTTLDRNPDTFCF